MFFTSMADTFTLGLMHQGMSMLSGPYFAPAPLKSAAFSASTLQMYQARGLLYTMSSQV